MQQMMDSPLMKSMLEDPARMQAMMEANPQTKAMLDSNPQMREMLKDPTMLKMSMEAMKNPDLMKAAMQEQLSQVSPAPTLQPAGAANAFDTDAYQKQIMNDPQLMQQMMD